jgi:hypothetical protein
VNVDLDVESKRDINTESRTALVKGGYDSLKTYLGFNLSRVGSDESDGVLEFSTNMYNVKQSDLRWKFGVQSRY